MERPNPSSIPETPGVYIYKDTHGTVIYVGKARCLRKRVLSYFIDSIRLTAKTRAMIAHASTIDMISTSTEKEALLLEASLIKRHRPHYNILLRDDKQYVLFKINFMEDYPRLEIVRKAKKDGAKYFGPYTSSLSARATWKIVHHAFPLRRCRTLAMKSRTRPCLYYDIGQCLAPCVKSVDKEEYHDLVKRVELFLSGKSKDLIIFLTKEMKNASDAQEYERAASLRDQIRAIKSTLERQSVVLDQGSDMDFAAVAKVGDGLGVGLLFVRDGKLSDGRNFFWKNVGSDDAPELLWSFLTQFYTDNYAPIPPKIIVSDSIQEEDEEAKSPDRGESLNTQDDITKKKDALPDEVDVEDEKTFARESLEDLLADMSGQKVSVRSPKGVAEHSLLEMARSNAREAGRKDIESISSRLARVFRWSTPVKTLICVDVSHTGGRNTRVGLVFFENGTPLKSEYRVYSIENANGDDYAALSEWAKRYAEHRILGEEEWPDCILIDGGKGQVSVIDKVFRECGVNCNDLNTFPFILAGIAKARNEEGRADRRAGNVADRIFPAGRSNPLPLREGSPELLFLQRVRDEAHRFSIVRHRFARGRQSLKSQLLSIPGIGEATAKKLWDAFGTVDKLATASLEQISKIKGINSKQAKNFVRVIATAL